MCIRKSKRTSRKRYSFHLKTSWGRPEQVLSGFRLFFSRIMPATWVETSSGQQRVGNRLLYSIRKSKEVVWTLITWALLEGLPGRWRVPQGTVSLSCLPVAPQAQSAEADFFLLVEAKRCPQSWAFVVQTLYTAYIRKSFCFKPEPELLCEKLSVGFVKSITFLLLYWKFALVASAAVSPLPKSL